MTVIQKLVFVIAVVLVLAPMRAWAEIPEGSTGMVRLSFAIGPKEGLYEPWLGVGFSHRSQAEPYDLWNKRNEGVESSVNFDLVAPQMAFGTQDLHTVFSWAKKGGYRASVGCDGPAPSSTGSSKNNTATNAAIAVGSAAVVGLAVYLFMDNDLVLATGC